jgi:hypothetical protein
MGIPVWEARHRPSVQEDMSHYQSTCRNPILITHTKRSPHTKMTYRKKMSVAGDIFFPVMSGVACLIYDLLQQWVATGYARNIFGRPPPQCRVRNPGFKKLNNVIAIFW